MNLREDVAGVEKEDGVGAGRGPLALLEEPERAGQRHRVEEVGADGDHHIHRARLDQLAPDV